MIQKLSNLLNFIGRNGTFIMPIGVIIGLLFPSLTQITKPIAEPIVILMLIVSIYRLDPNKIIETLRNFKIIGSGVLWILLIMPVFIFTIGYLTGMPSGLLAVVTAWSACPPLVSMPGLAILIGLDGAVALLLMIGSTLLFTISLPIILSLLVEQNLGLNPLSMAIQLFSIVSLSFIMAQGLRWLVGKSRALASEKPTDGVIVILMALFAITIMSGLHDALIHKPNMVPLYLGVAVAISAGSQIFNAVIFHRLNRTTGGAIALASGSRNLALLIPIASGSFAEDLWIFIAVVQIPIYFLPILSKPLYQKLYLQNKSSI